MTIKKRSLLIDQIKKSSYLLLCIVFLQCGSSRQPAATADSNVVFFDDFSGSKVDTSKWNIVITGQVVNNEQQAYVDSAATIYMVKGKDAEGAANGALVIHPRYAPGFITKDGKKFDFISGRINTMGKVDFMYGNVSARIKLSEGKGLWPAWWVLGPGRWPATGEIDIMEFVGENEWTNAAVHGPGYSGNTPFVKRVTITEKNPVTNWHVYSLTWTPDSLVFLLDDQPYYTVTKEMVSKYGNWAFDNAKYLILNFALGGGYPEAINKVRTPYFGLPAATVELVKQNKCRMLVDWVRITKLNKPAAQP